MKEIVKINLDNEMDLILAHKRAMKIAEMCGMPSAAQTRFSTAVSEIARCSIAKGKNSVLRIGINVIRPTQKEILAILTDDMDLIKCSPDAFQYAAKISGNIDYIYSKNQSVTKLSQLIGAPGLLSDIKIKSLVDYFRFEPPLSPYDEIRKKNIELIALSEKLGESENRYRQLANTLPVLICIVNERNYIVLENDSLKDYVQTPLIAFDKKSMGAFIHPDDVERLEEGWNKAKKNRAGYNGETRIKKGLCYVWHLVSIIPNKAEDGSFNSWLVHFVDIDAQKKVAETLKDNSELKVIQGELENANSKLLFKNKELEQFAFIASHDLQEPLRKILIMLSRAAEYLTEEQRKLYYFDKITLAARRLSALISDVLNYSRIDNKFRDMEEVDLNDIINETINDLSMVIEEKNAVVTVHSLPVVSGISSQLRQLYYNLINNALKFNALRPEVMVFSPLESENPEAHLFASENYHIVGVKDNGIGIETEYSGRIFDMFQRLHPSDQFGGNGIGLALCKRIMENHNGMISFTSKPEQGTTFWIYLPKSADKHPILDEI